MASMRLVVEYVRNAHWQDHSLPLRSSIISLQNQFCVEIRGAMEDSIGDDSVVLFQWWVLKEKKAK